MSAGEPVIEGWFTTGTEPALLGHRCSRCGTYQFPPTGSWCPNPACGSEEMERVPLSRTGRVWSYTDARYPPPLPYVPRHEPFRPFAIVAVELERERMVILGQVADGFGVSDLVVGAPVELVVEPLEGEKLVWRWRPITPPEGEPREPARANQ
jgi:uncharacterized OB-fold protein